MHKLICFLVLLPLLACQPNRQVDNYSIIPLPQSINYSDTYLEIGHSLKFQSNYPDGLELKELFTNMAELYHLKLDDSGHVPLLLLFNPEIAKESYHLKIDDEKISIESSSKAGWIYGFQSFLQMLPLENNGATALRRIDIA